MNKEDYKKSWESAIYKIADLQEENEKLRKTIKDDDLTINKLCKENKQLKEQINVYKNPDDLTLMFMYCDEKAKDKIKDLQQRINKAIEYIEDNSTNTYLLKTFDIDMLLEILKEGEE